MPNQPVAEECPLRLRHQFHQVLLDFDRISLWREPETMGKAGNMGVHDDPHIYVKRITQHNVGGLASNAAESE